MGPDNFNQDDHKQIFYCIIPKLTPSTELNFSEATHESTIRPLRVFYLSIFYGAHADDQCRLTGSTCP